MDPRTDYHQEIGSATEIAKITDSSMNQPAQMDPPAPANCGSRELKPGTTAVVTVGTIHGGLKRNIISDEVKLELTLRAFDDKFMAHLIDSIRRICAGTAQAAGVPNDLLPVVTLTPESISVTRNDPALTRRLSGTFTEWFGADRVKLTPPVTGGEDFSEFGLTAEHVPICMRWVGATDPAKMADSERTGIPVPSNHSATFAPVPAPMLRACITPMTAAVLELMSSTSAARPNAA